MFLRQAHPGFSHLQSQIFNLESSISNLRSVAAHSSPSGERILDSQISYLQYPRGIDGHAAAAPCHSEAAAGSRRILPPISQNQTFTESQAEYTRFFGRSRRMHAPWAAYLPRVTARRKDTLTSWQGIETECGARKGPISVALATTGSTGL